MAKQFIIFFLVYLSTASLSLIEKGFDKSEDKSLLWQMDIGV